MARFGLHDHHAVGGTQSVDGCRGVLENRNRFDVVGVDIVELCLGALHAVDDVERRVHAADADLGCGTRATVAHTTVDTGDGSGQGRRSVHRRIDLQSVARDVGDGSRDRGFFLYAVAYDHHVVEYFGVLLQSDGVGVAACGYGHFCRLESQIGDRQDIAGLGFQAERSVGIGRRAGRRALDDDAYADERCAVLVRNPAGDGIRLRRDGRLRLCCGAQGEDDLPVAQRIADVRSGEQPVENLTNGLVFGPECHFAGDVYQGLVVEKTVFTLPFDAGHGLFERDVAHVECDSAVLRIGSGAEQQPPEQQCETAQRTAEDRNVPSVPEVCHLICFHKWLL